MPRDYYTYYYYYYYDYDYYYCYYKAMQIRQTKKLARNPHAPPNSADAAPSTHQNAARTQPRMH